MSPERPDKSEFTEALNYKWVEPEPSKIPSQRPTWQAVDSDPTTDLRENMISDEWPVVFLRASIEALGVKPKGRTRDALTRQYVDTFANPQRLLNTLQSLPETESLFYAYFILHYQLVNNHTQPTSLDRLFPDYAPGQRYVDTLLQQGLAMQNRYDEYFYPRTLLRFLPQLEVQFKPAQTSETYIPAHAPHLLAIQLQQFLAALQQESIDLRPQLTWHCRSAYNSWHREWQWPIPPDTARMLEDQREYSGVIDLLAPEPALEQNALSSLVQRLGIPENIVDFLYRCMVQAGAVYPGSPVHTDDNLISRWITLPAGRQVAILFQQYTKLSHWASWWHAWSEGKINVGWDYDSYHYGSIVQNSMRLTVTLLRRTILDIMAILPQGMWISTKHFIRWVTKIFPSQKTQQYQNTLRLNGPGGSWKSFIEQAVLAMLTGPLHWLGFADLAPDSTSPQAFRLHHLQDIHWQRIDAVPAPASIHFDKDSLVIEGQHLNLHLPAPSDVLAFIQEWAITQGFSGTDLMFEFSVPLLHGCFEMGETAESLRASWEALVGFPVPSQLQEWWTYWDAHYGHIRLYTHQSALVTRDAMTLTEIQAAIPAIQPGIRGLVAPNFALLDDGQVDDIIKHLKRQGYMPKED